MTRKPARSKEHKPAGPQPAQLDAVRKLSYRGQHEQALERTAELRARYPDFKPLLALSWEVADSAGDDLSACLHAWDWSAASPASLAAQEALRDSAFAAGFPALGASVAQKLALAQGQPMPDLPALQGALGDVSIEQAVAIDLSRLFLSHGRFAQAISALEGLAHPSARNNLALARFAQGDVAAALDIFEANRRQDERNQFALAHALQLRLWRGGRGAVDELADALRAAQPQRSEDAYSKMFSLLLLGEYEAALAAWRALAEAPFWHEGSAAEESACAYFAGLAALRTGDTQAADELFADAIELDPDNLDADAAALVLTFPEPGAETDAKAGAFHDWFPQTWLAQMKAAKGAQAMDAALQSLQRACDAHADYLCAAAEWGGELVRFLALSILKARAVDGDAGARDCLRGLLTRPCGPDRVRIELDTWLQENGLIDASGPQQLLLRGEAREVSLRPMRLHADPKDIGLPSAAQSRLAQMHGLLAQNEPQRALRIAEELAAAHPGIPTLIGNIAAIKDALGAGLDEIEALFARAAELDPDYLFAQAGLARVAARRGDTQRARDLLAPLEGREQYHFSEWRAILMVELQIAHAQDDRARMVELNAALQALVEQFR